MSDIIDLAQSVLSNSESRLETVARNVSNTATSGFKAQSTFPSVMSVTSSSSDVDKVQEVFTDFTQGKLSQTDNPLDFAISGSGFFEVSSGDDIFLTRSGQFQVRADGHVVSPEGYTLKQANGDDLVVGSSTIEVLSDGQVMSEGRVVGQIGIVDVISTGDLRALSGSLFQTKSDNTTRIASPNVRQGMIETANVTLSSEMLTMMDAIRQAETGARLVQTYDTLIGQAISTFGQSSR